MKDALCRREEITYNKPGPSLRMIIQDESSEQLLLRLQKGDQAAFEPLVNRFKNQLMNLVFRYVGNREDSEDVVQDALVKVYINIDKYDPQYKATTWIYTITLNLARSAYRKKFKWLLFSALGNRDDDESEFIDQIADWSLSPEFFSDATHQEEVIEKALAQINPVFREAVILRDMEGCSYEEIAAIMNLNMGTVKSKINRGRQLLKTIIQKELHIR